MPNGQACMVVTIRDGRIVRMQDHPNCAAALVGAGLPAEPPEPVKDTPLVGDEPILNPDAPLALTITEAIHAGSAADVKGLLLDNPGLARALDSATRHAGSRGRSFTSRATGPGHFPGDRRQDQEPDRGGRGCGPALHRPAHRDAAALGCLKAMTSTRSMRCSTTARTSKPAAPSSAAAPQSPTPSPSASGGQPGGCWSARTERISAGGRTRPGGPRPRQELASAKPDQQELDNALWCAAHGGQRDTRGAAPPRGGNLAW